MKRSGKTCCNQDTRVSLRVRTLGMTKDLNTIPERQRDNRTSSPCVQIRFT